MRGPETILKIGGIIGASTYTAFSAFLIQIDFFCLWSKLWRCAVLQISINWISKVSPIFVINLPVTQSIMWCDQYSQVSHLYPPSVYFLLSYSDRICIFFTNSCWYMDKFWKLNQVLICFVCQSWVNCTAQKNQELSPLLFSTLLLKHKT